MDEKRLTRMIHLAMYEQVDGKEDIEISKYFRLDYIGMGLLKNILLITIAYFIILGFVCIYNFEFLAVNLPNLNTRALILALVVAYIIAVGFYSVIVFIIRAIRYEKAARRVNRYDKKLYELLELYESYDRKKRKERKDNESTV